MNKSMKDLVKEMEPSVRLFVMIYSQLPPQDQEQFLKTVPEEHLKSIKTVLELSAISMLEEMMDDAFGKIMQLMPSPQELQEALQKDKNHE